MVVEDDTKVIEVTSFFLEDAGHAVLTATSAQAALDLFSRHPNLDVLLTDVNLRDGCNGIELARRARARGCRAAVILVSGDLGWSNTAPDADMHFLAKPFGRTALLDMVASACPVRALEPQARSPA